MKKKRTRGTRLDARTLPAARAFARGYLHEDALVEHGSAAAAAAAFARDASDEEREALIAELSRIVAASAQAGPVRLAPMFARLGSAWVPESLDDVKALLTALRKRGAQN